MKDEQCVTKPRFFLFLSIHGAYMWSVVAVTVTWAMLIYFCNVQSDFVIVLREQAAWENHTQCHGMSFSPIRFRQYLTITLYKFFPTNSSPWPLSSSSQRKEKKKVFLKNETWNNWLRSITVISLHSGGECKCAVVLCSKWDSSGTSRQLSLLWNIHVSINPS